MLTPYLENPVRLRLPSPWVDKYVSGIRKEMSFTDTGVGHRLRLLKKAQRNPYNRRAKEDPEGLAAEIAELEKWHHRCILFEDDKGYWIYSGYRRWVEQTFNVKIPSLEGGRPRVRGFVNPLPFEPHGYQTEACRLMLAEKHAAVSLATGMGKSVLAAMLLREIGMSAVIIAPTLSIAGQLFEQFSGLFGATEVGRFYDGKKESSRPLVVAVSNSLALVEEGSEHWNNLCKRGIMMVDESHLCPVDMLEKVCMKLLEHVEYRFFFSGTQIRNDGLGPILTGLIGPIVMHKTVHDGVQLGTLSEPSFYQINTISKSRAPDSDPIRSNRAHFQDNPIIMRQAALIAEKAVAAGGRVLILVEQVEQFKPLYQALLKTNIKSVHLAGFAYGSLTKKNKGFIPEFYWKSDPSKLIKQFDAGEFPILVGTSCIGMGSDTKSPTDIIDLVGLKSPIRIPQAVGRGTRRHPATNKSSFRYWDFRVNNVPSLVKHADARAKIFREIYAEPKLMNMLGA